MFPIEVICNINCYLHYNDSIKLLMTCKDYYFNEYIRYIRRNYIIHHHENLQQLFLTAIAINDIKTVKFLLKDNKINTNYEYSIYNTNKHVTAENFRIYAIHLAIILCNYKIVKLLLTDNRLDINLIGCGLYSFDIKSQCERSLLKLTNILIESGKIFHYYYVGIINHAILLGYPKIVERIINDNHYNYNNIIF